MSVLGIVGLWALLIIVGYVAAVAGFIGYVLRTGGGLETIPAAVVFAIVAAIVADGFVLFAVMRWLI